MTNNTWLDANHKPKHGSYESNYLGSGAEISIRNLVEQIAKKIYFEGKFEWNTSKPDGQPRRRLDTSRDEVYFDWVASADLEEGLRRTIGWYELVLTDYPAGGTFVDVLYGIKSN